MGGSLDNDLPTADLLSSTTNEAAHRLQVIDRLLIDCLGWPPERIECEEHQAGDYLGYLLGRPGASTSSATAAGSGAGPVPSSSPRNGMSLSRGTCCSGRPGRSTCGTGRGASIETTSRCCGICALRSASTWRSLRRGLPRKSLWTQFDGDVLRVFGMVSGDQVPNQRLRPAQPLNHDHRHAGNR